jgi:uncharacterized protein (UPF0261 family)
MSRAPVILLLGTVDTKRDQMAFLRDCIEHAGARALVTDVGVLGQGTLQPDITNAAVAEATGVGLAQVRASEDENGALLLMARGARRHTTGI